METKQVSSCLRVKPASASLMAQESTRSRRRPGSSASRQGLGNRGIQGFSKKCRRLWVGAEQGSQRQSPGPGEGALFPRRRAWLTEQCIRRRAGGARGTQQSHSLARARGA